mmetsp:Transcript_22993/g.48909  ORF Transcript_22993/g.48909 Transcript_22993/m.48909 type:complete len:235 (+) Transcript_22993:146-850(+)
MASASDARVGKVKVNSSIMAAALASGMDLSGFRIGKQRLISKMKKKTSLKKVILEEREYNKAKGSGLDPGAATLAAGIGGFDAEASNLSLDAPDFVPGWGENDAEKESDGSADTSESGSEAGTDSDPDPNDDDDDDDASSTFGADVPSQGGLRIKPRKHADSSDDETGGGAGASGKRGNKTTKGKNSVGPKQQQQQKKSKQKEADPSENQLAKKSKTPFKRPRGKRGTKNKKWW